MDILVDSGSQQPPLIASRWAKQWGLQLVGTSATRQAGGALLPIYEVGTLQLGVNGEIECNRPGQFFPDSHTMLRTRYKGFSTRITNTLVTQALSSERPP